MVFIVDIKLKRFYFKVYFAEKCLLNGKLYIQIKLNIILQFPGQWKLFSLIKQNYRVL